MIRLVPAWTENYDEFWRTIIRRNLFFIKLRYAAILMLAVFALFSNELFEIELCCEQRNMLYWITGFLLLYNVALHAGRKKIKLKPDKINPAHLSLFQIIIDLITLTMLVHITGGIESPLYLFYIFHMIIGSLILPGLLIYSIAFLSVLTMVVIVWLEYNGTLLHYSIPGLLSFPLYQDTAFVTMSLAVFAMMMFTSVFIANRIATQLYSQEKNLIDALNQLNESEIKKQKYIMGVVHEIKSPIVAVQSIVEILLGGLVEPLSDKVIKKLERVKVRSADALDMINNILKISRLRLLSKAEMEETDLSGIVYEIISKLDEVILSKKILLKQSEEGEKRTALCEKSLVQLAVSNVIGNSIKYTDKGGTVEIQIKYREYSVLLSVCDNGAGIPKNEMEKIFDTFYRASNMENAVEGSGIGLSLVKEIVEQHQGKISVESPSPFGDENNPGTCFKIILPYSEEDAKRMKEFDMTIKGGV